MICAECCSSVKPNFINQPVCLFVELFDNSLTDESYQLSNIPLVLAIGDKTFVFLSGSIYDQTREHYTAIFRINGRFLMVDNLKATSKIVKNGYYKLKTLYYYLK